MSIIPVIIQVAATILIIGGLILVYLTLRLGIVHKRWRVDFLTTQVVCIIMNAGVFWLMEAVK
jgi:hypothetical protein